MKVLSLVKIRVKSGRKYLLALSGQEHHKLEAVERLSQTSGEAAYKMLIDHLSIRMPANETLRIETNVEVLLSHFRNPTARFPDLEQYKKTVYKTAARKNIQFKVHHLHDKSDTVRLAPQLLKEYLERPQNTRHTTSLTYQPLSNRIISKNQLPVRETPDIVAYTDGSYDETSKVGSYVTIVYLPNDQQNFGGVRYETDSGIMEMTAIYEALMRVPAHTTLEIRTDYQPIISAFETRKLPRHPSHIEAIKDIIQLAEEKDLRVILEKVQSHKNEFTNNVVDNMSRLMMQQTRQTIESLNLQGEDHPSQ